MIKKQISLIILILMMCSFYTSSSFAEIPSAREWANGVQQFRKQVLEPLDEHFAGQDCISDLKPYGIALANKASETRASIDEKVYMLLRESIIATTEELSPFQGVISCDEVDWWQLIRTLIEKKLEFMANVFALVK